MAVKYLATDCSFYQTPTPTAAARNESKSGLIISIENENIWKEQAIASGFCETADGSVPNRKLIHFCGIFFNLCVQIVCIAAAQKRY